MIWPFKSREKPIYVINFSKRKYDILPFVRQAVKHFGGIREDQIVRLATLIQKYFNHGNAAEMIAREGRHFTKEECAERGLPRWPAISHESYEMVEDSAKADPVTAIRRIYDRTAAYVYGTEAQLNWRDPDVKNVFPWIQVHIEGVCCKEMTALSWNLIPAKDAPLIPLWDCVNETCFCRGEPLMQKEAMKLKHFKR